MNFEPTGSCGVPGSCTPVAAGSPHGHMNGSGGWDGSQARSVIVVGAAAGESSVAGQCHEMRLSLGLQAAAKVLLSCRVPPQAHSSG